MSNSKTHSEPSIRINTIIRGDPAQFLLEWKKRGIAKSNSDAIRQAFRVFQDLIIESDLKAKQRGRLR